MKVCLVCVEFFGWGKCGGFGRATRMIGRELARRGIETVVVVPRRHGQPEETWIDGMRVLSYPWQRPWRTLEIFRRCDADIYHSQEASMGTVLAMIAMPKRRHIITFRDLKTLWDWLIELRYPSRHRLATLLAWVYERNPMITWAIKRADGLYCCAPHMTTQIQRLYRLKHPPGVLATAVEVPEEPPRKSADPLVVFLSRWDRRKRPQLFFELAKLFPQVRFLAFGCSQDEAWDRALRSRHGGTTNLTFAGFVDQFEDDQIWRALSDAWILINTSAREGLPTAMLEALAHRCALLSHINTDHIASRFGFHAGDGDLAAGLEALLCADAWREKGEAGYAWVREKFELDRVIDQHVAVYRQLTAERE
jgi:glycosyltransferase involved in cell wall biosynthesis